MPALIILHGTHGFAEEYLLLARDMARRGVLGVAGCWFEDRRGWVRGMILLQQDGIR